MKPGRLHGACFASAVVSLAVILSTASAQDGVLFQMYEPEPQYYQSGPRSPRSILQNFAVERMLKDRGFVKSIINCVLDKGPCESNGRKLRLMAPEILRGQCPGCSRTVHNQIRRVISHVQRNFPVEWSEVTRRFMSMSYGSSGQESYQPHQPHQTHQPHQPHQQPHQPQQPYQPPADPNMYQTYG